MTPLVLGHPMRGAIRVLELLHGMSATIAWSDHAALEESVDEVLALGGSTLFVDIPVEGIVGASMAHQQQVMGTPSFVVVVVDDDAADLAAACGLARAGLTSLPPSALLVIGSDVTQSVMAELASELGLVPPLTTTLDDLPGVAAELAATARWESVS